jgi:hypothetical protein
MIFGKKFGRLDRDAVADAGEGHVVGVGKVLATSAADVGGVMASKEPLTGSAGTGLCTSAVTCASALATSHTPQVANR